MGMFDSIYLKANCPNCGADGEKEFQTKDLACSMDVYRVGQSIGTTQFRWLDGCLSCHSEKCLADDEKRNGYRSGFGTVWDCYAEIDGRGLITGRIETEIPVAIPKPSVEHQE